MASKTTTKEKTSAKEEQVDQIDVILAEPGSKGMHYGAESADNLTRPDLISTGSFYFDQVLGGGFRSSCWSRFYGPEESGKTAQGLAWGKRWQDHYGERAFVQIFNAEGRIFPDHLVRSGLDLGKDRFRIIRTNSSEWIWDTMFRLINDNPLKRKYFFMVDSTDACERAVDKEKSLAEPDKIGGTAALLSAVGRKSSVVFSATGHHLYLTSQEREKMTQGSRPGGKSASGGNAPKFYSSLTGRFLRHWSQYQILENPSDKESKEIGRLVQVRLEKTPNETTGTEVLVPVKYGKIGGVWREYEAMMMAQSCGKIDDKGSGNFEFHANFMEELKGAGVTIEKAKVKGIRVLREIFEANPDLVAYVHAEIPKILLAA